MENTADDTELNKHSSPSEVVGVGDVVVQNGQQRSRSNSTYSADLETAIAKTGFGKFSIALILFMIPASWAPGFNTGSMSYVIPSLDFNIKPMEKALLQSACYAGIISGGFLWGFMSDAFGRKKLMAIGFFSEALMNILAGAFPNIPLMIVFKYLAGFMGSGSQPILFTYTAEVFPIMRRDILVLSLSLYASIGQIIISCLATWIISAPVPSELPFKSWQLFQMTCCLPSVISGIAILFFMETPKFLADKGNHEGALKVCQTIYSINTGNLPMTYPIKRLNHNSKKTENISKLSRLLDGTDIFRPPFLQSTLILSLIYMGSAVSFNILHLWLPEILTLVSSSTLDPEQGLCSLLQDGSLERGSLKSELDVGTPFSKSIWVSIGCLIGQTILVLLLHYIDNKIMQFIYSFMSAICSLIMIFINADYIIIVASIYLALYATIFFCNANIALSIFPTRLRATCVSVMFLFGKTGTLVLNFVMANLAYNYCKYIFYGTAFTSIIIAGLTLLIRKEPIEEIPSKRN